MVTWPGTLWMYWAFSFNEPLRYIIDTFFGKFCSVAMDYLISTPQSHDWEHYKCTEHFLCWEHCNEISLVNFKCVCNILGGFLVGTLSMSLWCTCSVPTWSTTPCPQCQRSQSWFPSSAWSGLEFYWWREWILMARDWCVHQCLKLCERARYSWVGVFSLQLVPEFVRAFFISILVSNGMVEAESNIAQHLHWCFFIVIGVICGFFGRFSTAWFSGGGGGRCCCPILSRRRTYADFPLSLGHKVRLYCCSPLLVVGTVEDRDEGLESGRHFCKAGSQQCFVLSFTT